MWLMMRVYRLLLEARCAGLSDSLNSSGPYHRDGEDRLSGLEYELRELQNSKPGQYDGHRYSGGQYGERRNLGEMDYSELARRAMPPKEHIESNESLLASLVM